MWLIEKCKESTNCSQNVASRVMKCALFLTFFQLIISIQGFSQSAVLSDSSARTVEIDTIFITGNKRTKDFIILRELDVKVGETYNISDLNPNVDKKITSTHDVMLEFGLLSDDNEYLT